MQRSERRLDRLEQEAEQNYWAVTRLLQGGASLRSDLRRLTQAQAETDRALKALIQNVAHRNGRR